MRWTGFMHEASQLNGRGVYITQRRRVSKGAKFSADVLRRRSDIEYLICLSIFAFFAPLRETFPT